MTEFKKNPKETIVADINDPSEQRKLTIFTTPKPFRGHIGVIQTNAIKSWLQFYPECEIILFGAEEGVAQIASTFRIRHIPEVDCNEYGTPLISSMFKIAQDVANHQLMCYVNADIILMSDFLPAIRQIQWQSFLLIGRRWDIDLKEPIDFSNPNWEEQLRARLVKEGKIHAPTGLDYFVFPRGGMCDIPPFAVGRPGWDNWMVYQARSLRIPVIDATKAITAVHQNHDYAYHLKGGNGVWKGLEAERNCKLVGGYKCLLNAHDAGWLLTKNGIKRASPMRTLYQRWAKLRESLGRWIIG